MMCTLVSKSAHTHTHVRTHTRTHTHTHAHTHAHPHTRTHTYTHTHIHTHTSTHTHTHPHDGGQLVWEVEAGPGAVEAADVSRACDNDELPCQIALVHAAEEASPFEQRMQAHTTCKQDAKCLQAHRNRSAMQQRDGERLMQLYSFACLCVCVSVCLFLSTSLDLVLFVWETYAHTSSMEMP